MASSNEAIDKKKRNYLGWKVIFITLLIINILFVLWAILLDKSGTENWAGLYIIFFSLPVLIVDFIAVIFYIQKKRSQPSLVKIASNTAFIAICFILNFQVWQIIIFIYYPYLRGSIFDPIPWEIQCAVMAILVTLLLTIVYLRPLSRK
jgi:cytochrome bd-type quinol oxidase subunit 2